MVVSLNCGSLLLVPNGHAQKVGELLLCDIRSTVEKVGYRNSCDHHIFLEGEDRMHGVDNRIDDPATLFILLQTVTHNPTPEYPYHSE